MDILTHLMIYAGSALMVYNIWRCYGFVRGMRDVRGLEKLRPLLPVPLVLLVSFLVGYLLVGLFGAPDPIVAGILFGGSVFVFVVLNIMYSIIERLREARARSDALYQQILDDLGSLAQDFLSVARVNLTRDVVEELMENGSYHSEGVDMSYTEYFARRNEQLIAVRAGDAALRHECSFSRDELLECYEQGRQMAEQRVLLLLDTGEVSFVKLTAQLAAEPRTGDVVAFITEERCNDEMVNEVLLSKALIGQFDMITSLMDGAYRVVIGDSSVADGANIFPHELEGDYQSYLTEQVLPVVRGDVRERERVGQALSFARVEQELQEREPYEVTIAIVVGGELRYKRFVFYVVDRDAHFYLLLKSDTTEARREELERNEQLQEALEEAQRASQAKTMFLSNMSHDIRTPMNAIVGYTEMARKSDDIQTVHQDLDKIDASSKYLLALINDVLEMSRIESGRLELDPEPADLTQIMREVQALFETQMAEKGVAYTVDVRVRHAYVLCDVTRTNRILLNLIGNAYKFTPAGGRVGVSLEELPGDGTRQPVYELSVRDNGIGMSQEFAAKVFDAFERERTSTASGIQGTGLGMAITKRIVDLMGGTIEVFSEQGKGTEFVVRVSFPVTDAPARGGDAEQAGALEPIDFTGMRVLLAEDNEINREIASVVLEELGFEVDMVENGQQALDVLVAAGPGAYDAVVTDIQMPVMDGLEEARAIRALPDPELARVPIVAMSANAFREDIEASRAAGIDAHVAKPIDVGAVIDGLTLAIGRAR